ncbi:hypothetical protein DB347_15095 [Opitutaceae bacterium EW11]|nr:hypothetical protein DB347_15095 [Opitutaceae bacterium EW11]
MEVRRSWLDHFGRSRLRPGSAVCLCRASKGRSASVAAALRERLASCVEGRRCFPGNPTKSYRSKEPVRVVGEVTEWQGHAPEVLFDGFEVGETGVVPIPNSPRAVIWSCYALRFLAPMRIRAVSSRLRHRGEQALRGVRRRLIR